MLRCGAVFPRFDHTAGEHAQGDASEDQGRFNQVCFHFFCGFSALDFRLTRLFDVALYGFFWRFLTRRDIASEKEKTRRE
jgi:hypothetical protein